MFSKDLFTNLFLFDFYFLNVPSPFLTYGPFLKVLTERNEISGGLALAVPFCNTS